jgi:YidC/Oxa1 family membrane protein insertase
MITAEMQRILLLVAMAATAYLMVLAWNDDYIKNRPVAGASSSPIAAAPEASAPDTFSEANDASKGTSIATHGEAAPPTHAKAAEAGQLIRVTTGTMRVWIDRSGGDINRVELPRYPVSIDKPGDPILLLDKRADHTYIAESGLIGRDGIDGNGSRPVYEFDGSDVELPNGGDVRLKTVIDGNIEVDKIFRFTANDYVVDVDYEIVNHSDRTLEMKQFGQLKRDNRDLSAGGSYTLGPKPYLGAALTTNSERYHKLTFKELDEKAQKNELYQEDVNGGWMAMLQHYFISAWIASPNEENHFYGKKRDDGEYVVGFSGPAHSIAAGQTAHLSSRFYAGPKDQARLEAIAPNLNLTVDYGYLWWLAVPLFQLLKWLHGVVGNWGVSIILLTLLVKLVLYPLSAASYRSMANMRRVAPQMKRLQERYADDRQKLSQEMMNFYKKEKINPLGGCLPMLLQMPVFLSLYWVLFESVELRQAPFFLWIRDLAVMDPYFVLPILMGGSMYLTQALSPTMPDPVQARVMKFMPVMFTVMFLFFPAGLVLYWLVNNLLSIAQQWFITRQIESGGNAVKS